MIQKIKDAFAARPLTTTAASLLTVLAVAFAGYLFWLNFLSFSTVNPLGNLAPEPYDEPYSYTYDKQWSFQKGGQDLAFVDAKYPGAVVVGDVIYYVQWDDQGPAVHRLDPTTGEIGVVFDLTKTSIELSAGEYGTAQDYGITELKVAKNTLFIGVGAYMLQGGMYALNLDDKNAQVVEILRGHNPTLKLANNDSIWVREGEGDSCGSFERWTHLDGKLVPRGTYEFSSNDCPGGKGRNVLGLSAADDLVVADSHTPEPADGQSAPDPEIFDRIYLKSASGQEVILMDSAALVGVHELLFDEERSQLVVVRSDRADLIPVRGQQLGEVAGSINLNGQDSLGYFGKWRGDLACYIYSSTDGSIMNAQIALDMQNKKLVTRGASELCGDPYDVDVDPALSSELARLEKKYPSYRFKLLEGEAR